MNPRYIMVIMLGLVMISLTIISGCSGDSEPVSAPSNGGMLIFYQGNNATKEIVCTIPIPAETDTWHFKKHRGWNDEARSLVLQDVPGSTYICIADDPDGDTDDDYLEIWVYEFYKYLELSTLETGITSDKIKILFHPYNGLDGKVSYCKISPW